MNKSKKEWMRGLREFKYDLALTLNFKADMPKAAAICAARHFWNSVDIQVYGKTAVKKRGMRVPRVCALEGEAGLRNWHYHCGVVIPPEVKATPELFMSQLKLRWEELREAGRFSKIERVYDNAGWKWYICKNADVGGEQICLETSVFFSQA